MKMRKHIMSLYRKQREGPYSILTHNGALYASEERCLP